MSKITPKNLSYDQTLPPFLQRLQANKSSLDGRNEFQTARPQKAKNLEDDAENEPVYFDEGSGETLTRREWEAKEKVKEGGDGGEVRKDGADGEGGKRGGDGEREKIAAIGSGKKRKAGKVIGAEDGDVDEKEKEDAVGELKKVEKGQVKKSESKSAKKKGKKIKLSFGDDE